MVIRDISDVGKIIELPRATNQHYVVHLINLPTPDLPANFNQNHLRTPINKRSKSDMDMLKAGHDSYDQKLPSRKNPLGNKKGTRKKAKPKPTKKAVMPPQRPVHYLCKGIPNGHHYETMSKL